MESYLAKAIEEESIAIKSFWYGKFLQYLYSEGIICDDQESLMKRTTEFENHSNSVPRLILGKSLWVHVNEAKTELVKCQSSLSPNVHVLVTQSIPLQVPDDIPCYLDDNDLTLNWSLVATTLHSLTNYTDIVHKLGLIAVQVYSSITSKPKQDVVATLTQWFHWTHNPQIYCDCLEMIYSDCPLSVYLALMISSAAIERSLGDIYLHISNAQHCPRLMRDLLETKELSEIFGEVPMLCLKALIGPPAGLNLRNILWHGFVTENEVPIQYNILLLVLIASLGKILSKVIGSIAHQFYASFPQEDILNEVFPEYSEADLQDISKLFEDSYFILPSMLPIWKASLYYYNIRQFGHCLCLLLPSLEHGLRRIYACCNNCPERILTAESTTLYTTFDEILSPTLTDCNTPNKLPHEIGHQKMEMLMDLLVYPDGPRLRDRISHGEVDLSCVSHTLASHVLNMCIVFCVQYSVSFKFEKTVTINRTVQSSKDYISLFHPISMLKREICHVIDVMEKWCEIKTFTSLKDNDDGELILSTDPHPNYLPTLIHLLDSFPYSHTPDFHAQFVSSSMYQDFDGDPLRSLVQYIWRNPFPTLFMTRSNLEIIGILRRIISHLVIAIDQVRHAAIQKYNLYQRKALRSRQRVNFNRLLSCVGVYWSSTVMVCCLVCLVITYIPSSHDLSHDVVSKVIKFLKKVLQFVENFSSQSTKNRWEEIEHLCTAFSDVCMKLPLLKTPPT